MSFHTYAYGAEASQAGDLYLPQNPARSVVCLLHGGFWRMPYGRADLDALCSALQEDGHAVWNLEYRRMGEPGAGWPGTFEDVAKGIDRLAEIAAEGAPLPLDRVVVAGHSAGGHLALWSAARDRFPGATTSGIKVWAAAGLAPAADLHQGFALELGRGAVLNFLERTPDADPERYRLSSPPSLLPLGTRQIIVHGTDDDAVPVSMSRDYVAAARAAGDVVDYVELEGAGHMDFLDPESAAIAAFREWLDRICA